MKSDKNLILGLWNYLLIILIFILTMYFLIAGMGYEGQHNFELEKVFLKAISVTLFAGLFVYARDLLSNFKNKLFLMLILFEGVYSLWHSNWFSFKKFFIDLSLYLIFYFSIPHLEKVNWIEKFSKYFFIFIALMIAPIWGHFFSIWHVDNTYRGAFIHRNELGYFLIALAIYLLNKNLNKYLKISFVLTFFFVLELTCSRSTLLASFFVFTTAAIMKNRKKFIFVIVFLHLAIAASWFPSVQGYFKNNVSVSGTYSDNGEKRAYVTSTEERAQLFLNGVEAYKEKPIMGRGNIFRSNSKFNNNMDVNCFYLSHLISYGLFPTIVIMILFVSFYLGCGLRARLMLVNLAVFAAFQSFFDYFQTAYFFATVFLIYLFYNLDYSAKSDKIS